MIIKKLNFDSIDSILAPHQLLFVLPHNCKVVRVYKVSKKFWGKEKYHQIVQILNTTCSLKKGVTWFYIPKDTERLHDAMLRLYDNMNIDAMLAEQEAPGFGYDNNNNPIPNILN